MAVLGTRIARIDLLTKEDGLYRNAIDEPDASTTVLEGLETDDCSQQTTP